jgi:hypothetical protein
MDILAKERSSPALGQRIRRAKWASGNWPHRIARQKLPAFLHELSFLLSQPVTLILLQRPSAQGQVLPRDLMPWWQFPESVWPFSFSSSASLRQFQSVQEDLPKSPPEAAPRVHWKVQHHRTKQQREFLGARASEILFLALVASTSSGFQRRALNSVRKKGDPPFRLLSLRTFTSLFFS